MSDPVSARLGRYRPERQNYAKRAHDKRVRQRINELIQETGWKGDLARSLQAEGVFEDGARTDPRCV